MKPIVVVKIGGASLEEAARRLPLLMERFQVIAIHGAGKQIDEALARKGIRSRKVKGLRVTSRECLNVVVKELEKANRQLVAELRKKGANAVPVRDAFRVKQKSRLLGYVGEITSVNDAGIRQCLAEGRMPAVMPVGYGGKQAYNINADTAARMLVLKTRPDRLILLNEEGGVKDRSGKVVRNVTSAGMEWLFRNRIVTGGMKLKLEELKKLLDAVDVEVIICSAGELGRNRKGTRVER